MNSRERFLTALRHKSPDRIPLDLGVGKACSMHVGFYKELLKYFGLREEIVLALRDAQTVTASDTVLEKLECDVRCAWPFFADGAPVKEWEDAKYFYYIDRFGTELRMPKDGGLYYDMHKPPLEGADETRDAAYAWPDIPLLNPDGLERAKRYQAAGFPVIIEHHMGNGFLQNGPRLYGYTDWFAMLASEEERVNRNLNKLLELKIQYYDRLFDMYGGALDVVAESDDLGMQKAPFISVEMFRKYMKPRYKILFDHVKKKSNAKILFHADGAMSCFIPDLIDVGVDILNPLQISCEGMDPARIKKEYGKDLAFWGGGVDTQKILPFGTPALIKESVKRNIDVLRENGGFIFSQVHIVQQGVPVENFMAMWETFMENRNY
jgi:uroporphyrinogen decarboxylase